MTANFIKYTDDASQAPDSDRTNLDNKINVYQYNHPMKFIENLDNT
jgi:hypothetical protein